MVSAIIIENIIFDIIIFDFDNCIIVTTFIGIAIISAITCFIFR